MPITHEQLYEIAKFVPLIVGLISVVMFVYNILKGLYILNVNVEKVLFQQDGQLSMHQRLQDALNEIKGIKLVCNERHKWDEKTERRKS